MTSVAAASGHLDVLRYLGEQGVNLAAEHGGALMAAADRGHFDIVRYLVEHGVHLRQHVLAVHDDLLLSRCPQGHVEHSALLGGVDLVAPEHRIDAVAQSHRLSQADEEAKRLVGHAVL